MAEAGRHEDDEFKDARAIQNRHQATDRTERSKPDHIQPRPLASIRAAFKRTSGRASSQSDNTRDRRRPEITILSAEPLTSTSWFPGASTGSPAVHSAQPVWSSNVPVDAKPPPSYEQVIQEKTQEQVLTPTPPPRRCHTTTSATQTDGLENTPDLHSLPTRKSNRSQEPKSKRPPKPPRPSFPVRPTPALRESPLVTAKCASTHEGTQTTSTEEIETSPSRDSRSLLPVEAELPGTDVNAVPCSTPNHTLPTSPSPPTASLPGSPHMKQPHPVPRPRTRISKPVCKEVKVQTLVRYKDSGDAHQVISDWSQDSPQSPYLEELLEAFRSDASTDSGDSDSLSSLPDVPNKGEDDSTDMSIRSKIQALETQLGDHMGPPGPVPKPRNQASKPPVLAPKPVMAPWPSVKRPIDENHNDRTSEESSLTPKLAPTPAPRPVLPKKPTFDQGDALMTTPKTALLPPSHPFLLSQSESSNSQRESFKTKVPPPVQAKPSCDVFNNNNNHNSTGFPSESSWVTEWPNHQPTRGSFDQGRQENEYRHTPAPAPLPAKPTHVEASFNRGGVARKPTMIRVPSSKSMEHLQEDPPPLPIQNPVGGSLSSHGNGLKSQDSYNLISSDLSLPPRPAGGKVLPPRPPPAKPGPGRPPPPRKDALQPPSAGSTTSKYTSQGHQEQRVSKPGRKGPVVPPRPRPGHPLYNKYTLEIPHAIAEFDCNGIGPGELSFQRNEVLALLHQIDGNTFECQAGAARGRVEKSYMKIITPLPVHYVDDTPQIQGVRQEVGTGVSVMQVEALYDFIPEGPGELRLAAGDVVSQVEQLDDEWYMGTLRGVTGFFPISYAKVMSMTPATPAKTQPKPSISGPRCVARFVFEAEHSDELAFNEGDLIQLLEHIDEEWSRGQLAHNTGIFPINFVEIIEDLPAQATTHDGQSTKIALPGMASSHTSIKNQADPERIQWAEALYDFTAETDDDLPFRQGERILVTAQLDEEWCSGRLNGKDGVFPKAFVQFC